MGRLVGMETRSEVMTLDSKERVPWDVEKQCDIAMFNCHFLEVGNSMGIPALVPHQCPGRKERETYIIPNSFIYKYTK